MQVRSKAERVLDRLANFKAEKSNWLPRYQLCAEYIMANKQGFTNKKNPGDPLTDQIYDDTAPNANALMTAALLGALWPNGAKSFRLGIPYGMEDELGGDTEECKDYYQWVTKTMASYMDNPKSGLNVALEEYMLDQGAFGISGIIGEDQDDDWEVPIAYRAVDAKSLYVAEGKNGFINTIYIEREYTIRQLVEKYGLENVNVKHREMFSAGKEQKVAVLQAIEPRMEADPYAPGVKNAPFASIHIDIANKKILLESGFHELPCAITRFWKAMGETYGRCPGMNAMPSILEANALGEAWSLAVEKTLDPSLLVMDDGSMGNSVIDTSPGGITVVSVSGRIGASHDPIKPLFLVGDLQWTAARRTEINQVIKNHFYQDRLLDMNNSERMQNPEVAIRNELRGQTLNTVYARQMSELFVPLIETTFNKLNRRGLLGVIQGSPKDLELQRQGITPKYIPDAVVERMKQGREVYRIEFISPATRIMQADEMKGLEHLITSTVTVAPVNPSVMDILDWDWIYRRMQELDGSPREAVNSVEKIRKIRSDRQALAQQQADAAAAQQTSETARNLGQAASSAATATKAA